jgi:hypothetical protein
MRTAGVRSAAKVVTEDMIRVGPAALRLR